MLNNVKLQVFAFLLFTCVGEGIMFLGCPVVSYVSPFVQSDIVTKIP